MLDIQVLRDNPDWVAQQLQGRGFAFDSERFKTLEAARKHLQIETQELQAQRNSHSKDIGRLRQRGEDFAALQQSMGALAEQLTEKKTALDNLLAEMEQLLLSLPNLPHESVPVGKDETDNVEICRVGQPPEFSFTPRSHDELGERLGQMDFAMAAKITGSRFVVMHRQIARLHRALIQFMMDVHSKEHAYQEVYVPYIVNQHSLYGTGQLPKFSEDLFKLTGDQEYYLTSTAEIPVTNIVRDDILAAADLPLRWVCHSPCFRSEAGSYGRDTKGMIRQHQFEKVELVWVCHPDQSYDALAQLRTHAEAILQKLALPYRVVSLCTGDMGASAAKTFDLEVWLPSQNCYREISSCSNMEAFQARRLKARFRSEGSKQTEWVHTLNGSGLAVGRTLVAILENYQTEEGAIHIPAALQPYMDGLERIDVE
ncbi:MAG: serine--tRNA ligase [Legionellaceae bacterium]|nr:serine--tRNA ligase [Legionellaceae bacterium]